MLEAPNYIDTVPDSLLRPGIDDPDRCAPRPARLFMHFTRVMHMLI